MTSSVQCANRARFSYPSDLIKGLPEHTLSSMIDQYVDKRFAG